MLTALRAFESSADESASKNQLVVKKVPIVKSLQPPKPIIINGKVQKPVITKRDETNSRSPPKASLPLKFQQLKLRTFRNNHLVKTPMFFSGK
jgi:hypothetical protein